MLKKHGKEKRSSKYFKDKDFRLYDEKEDFWVKKRRKQVVQMVYHIDLKH